MYTKAISIDPQNAVYFANRAFAHIKLEEYGSAVADASQAIEIDSTYAKVAGLILIQALKYSQAYGLAISLSR